MNAGGLFDAITQKHEWTVRKVTIPTLDEWLAMEGRRETYDRHAAAIKSAERFVKECVSNQYPRENDTLYEALFWWSWEQRAAEVKAGKLPEFVSKMCKRFDRGDMVFRDYVFEMVGRL